MRIISGTHKGKRLNAPKTLPVRPTTDMAKEGLFNILNNRYYFDELNVLDLFAGTGNISLEFASRGTEHITSVDNHYGCVKFITETANQLNLPIHVIKSDVFKYLDHCTQQFDIIFADPPYHFDVERFESLVQLVFDGSLLREDGLLIIEHSKHTNLSDVTTFNDSRGYGGSVFSFFKA